MKRLVWPLLVLTGCLDAIDPRWQLDHDHVIAARATPPRIRAGDATNLDALVAHHDEAVTIENPISAELSGSPAGFARYLTQEHGAWKLTAPSSALLAGARPAMGLPEDAPVPVDVLLTFPRSNLRAGLDPFKVKKTVWLGEPSTNPLLPPVLVGDALAGDEIVVPIGTDVYLAASVPDGQRVNWLTNVGTLFQDDVPRAFVRVLPEDKHAGELVVVIRDREGGVTWRVWPMRAE